MCSLDASSQHHVGASHGVLVNRQKCPDPNLLNQTVWGRIRKPPWLADSPGGLLSRSPASGTVSERMRLEMGS